VRRSGKLLLVRDIVRCIFNAAPEGASISRIVSKANTTHKRAKAVLDILQLKELVKRADGRYHLTDKGKSACKDFERLELLAQALGMI